MSLQDIKKERLEKIKKLEAGRINPYPGVLKRSFSIREALENFQKIKKEEKDIFLVGRIRSIRSHGKITFFHFEDGTGRIQGVLRIDKLGETKYNSFFEFFDVGDFIEVRGYLILTKKGEKSIEAIDFKILAKSLLPLPEKWHGLKDIEERYRKRYLDLIFNPEVKEKFEKRAKVLNSLREFLEKEGFLEVETPILQPIYGGAKARPFKTHLNALDMTVFLRIAPELYLKRLLVGGFEKVYEMGKVFRNEGIDKSHNPEYTQLEFYWAYTDYKEMMKLVERMIVFVAKSVLGKTNFKYEGQEINLKIPFERIEFEQLFRKYTDIILSEIHPKALMDKAKEMGIEIEKGEGKVEIADKIYKKFCLPKVVQPTFIINHPVGTFPLAKALDKNPEKLASFQLVIAGWELALGFSELNNPLEQERRFKEQERYFKQGLEEAQRMDKDFIEALKYGMPPAAGFGMGVDRLIALLTNSHSIKEVILFPFMKKRNRK